MAHTNLLYYQNVSALEAEQGTGGTVTTVRPGVGWAHEQRDVRFNKKKVTYTVTVNYKNTGGTSIAQSTTAETGLVLEGREAKIKLSAIDVDNYAPIIKEAKVVVSENSNYDFIYKRYTAYTLTVQYRCSGETISEDTTITSDRIPEGDFAKITFEPKVINGYAYSGTTPITIRISSDTTYTLEYYESAGAELGDIVYYDGSVLKNVSWEDWSDSLGTPVGIITIPSNVAPDRNARMMAPLKLSGATPMAQYPVENKYYTVQTYYAAIPTWNNDSGSPSYSAVSYETGHSSYSDLPIDALSNYPCAGNGDYGYGQYGPGGEESDKLIPPMINPDGSLNENAIITLTGGNALTDWNGLGNSLAISATDSYAEACLGFSIACTAPGDWYLPSLGEMCYSMSNIAYINNILNNLFGEVAITIGAPTSTKPSENTRTFYFGQDGDINISNPD